MSTVAAANFLLYITEALRRFVRANPNETFEDDIPALLPAPPTLEQEEVVNAPHVQGTDEEEEDEGDEVGAGVLHLDDNEEDENENEPDAEDGEAVLVQPELRRYNTMIVDFYEVSHYDHIVNFCHSPCSTSRTNTSQVLSTTKASPLWMPTSSRTNRPW